MPRLVFDDKFRIAIGDAYQRLTQEIADQKLTFNAEDKAVLEDVMSQMMLCSGSMEPDVQAQAWRKLSDVLFDKGLGGSTANEIPLDVLVTYTENLTNNEAINHWHFCNLLAGVYQTLSMLAEPQKMAPVSDHLKDFRTANEEYLTAKDEAVRAVSMYSSLEDLDDKFANALADVRRYQEEVDQLNAQKDYRQNSYQAIMVTVLNRTNEERSADQAFTSALLARDEQKEVAARAKARAEAADKAARLKEQELRERAKAIQDKRDALNAELEKLAKDVDGETSATVNAVSKLNHRSIEAKQAVDNQLALMTRKPKSDAAARANKLYSLLEGRKENQHIWSKIESLSAALEANPRLAKTVETQGDGYTRTSEKAMAFVRQVKTDSNMLALQYVDLFNSLKAHYEMLDSISHRYEVDADGNNILDQNGNLIPKKSYTQEFMETCHSMADLKHHANVVDSVYNALAAQAVDHPEAKADERKALAALRDAHYTYSALENQKNTAKDSLDSKQDELNKFCISVYDESEKIEREIKDLLSDSEVALRASLHEKAQKEAAKLSDLEKDVDAKRQAHREAFDAKQKVLRERDIWMRAERARDNLKDAQERLKKHSAALEKIRTAHEKHDVMVQKANVIKQDMPEGKMDLQYFVGITERVGFGLQNFVRTAHIGRENLKKFADPNYDRRHHNSTEYNNMLDTLNAAFAGVRTGAKRPEELKEVLAGVRAAAQTYLDAKNHQRMHWIPSPQRKIRLAFAQELIRFCDNAAIGVQGVKDRADSLEKGYTVNKIGTRERATYDQIRAFVGVSAKAPQAPQNQPAAAVTHNKTIQHEPPQIALNKN